MNLSQSEEQYKIESSDGSSTVIAAKNISKKFCRSLKKAYIYGLKDIASELLGISRQSEHLRAGEFWALKDIELELKKGESIGIIGVNGSGKSTLMNIIGGLLKPDTGYVRVNGRVAPLRVLGAGFKPNLTGRENVYINMSMFGLSKEEIDDNFQNVLDFAEIWEAVDAPVRTYSSGMRARLGFACAIFTNPDILLIDEVLAVGDFAFRAKCYRKLSELRQRGVSFFMVSHTPGEVLSTCESAIYLADGRMVMNGPVDEVVKKYEEDLMIVQVDDPILKSGKMNVAEERKISSSELQIKSLFFQDTQGNILESLTTGQPVYFCIECEAYKDLENVSVNIIIGSLTNRQSCYLRLNSGKDRQSMRIPRGKCLIKLFLPYCGLVTGAYNLKLNLGTHHILDAISSFRFEVRGNERISHCSFYQPRKWEIEF
jgi:lipopolysaccharide transport system ATP-binding protein